MNQNMKKKKITKLEIKKEDILNLTQNDSQKIIGGGDILLTVDYGNDCPASQPANCDTDYSKDCSERLGQGCQSYTDGIPSCTPGCGVTVVWTCTRT
ncbi:class I lanthipeptide [Elizabethkingia occulta]|uniref:Uncharacterized protein n=1 Tax=Elizabethkingia occulta TaxID=1867263 RepID=A0A1T3MGG7_9FLAO|nr:class I lanthipeptide [Elizabethkingia occulta]OPB93997.1 hypothetical protein BB020_00965 [Elizabethkingia occulta]OPC63712.1 hypothetical protein BAZ10_06440 [Elizabethkingia occulta]